MNVIKSVVKAVLPILANVLRKAAKSTETEFDDHVVEGVIKAIESWLNEESETEQNFV
jgi:hypothetical protein